MHIKKNLAETESRLPTTLLSQLQPAIQTAFINARQRSKTTLQCKYDKLKASTHQRACNTNYSHDEPTKGAAPNRVSILGNISVSQPALNTLSKGPKFTLSPRLSRDELQHSLQVETAALAYSIRWHYAHNQDRNSTTTLPTSPDAPHNLNRICPFRNKRSEPPRQNKDIERSLQGLQTDLQRLAQRFDPHTIRPNISHAERRSITALKNEDNVTITRSDKGGEMVIMHTDELQRLCLDHHNDSTTYERLKKDPTNNIRLKINKSLDEILTRCNFPRNLIYNLQTPTSARTQRFYALPKTHKKTLKIRPIVSACGGIFDRLGWLLQLILKPLLKHVPAHLDNTTSLLRRFHNTDKKQLKGKIPISFDVVSLYTNIDTDEAIDTALQYTNKYGLHTYGLLTQDLFILLHLLLDNNIFTYDTSGLYKQIRGLAMGSRLSGTLAILAMDRFERLFIYQTLQPPLTIYVRYVDDIGTTVLNTTDAHNILAYLNSKHPTIKFELELPDTDGYLPILDIQLKIDEHGNILHKLFTKKASKNITLHYLSHHPRSVKKAVVTNELTRATLCSSTAHRQDSISSARTKLIRNGYPSTWLNEHTRNHKQKTKKNHPDTLFTLKIPFISDTFNYQVRRILNKHNIPARLTNIPGLTLQKLTTKHSRPHKTTCNSKTCPAPTICQRSNVVYETTCNLCQLTYIGQTTRRLHDRAREHLTAATHKQRTSALGEHYADSHPNSTPDLSFTILRTNPDALRLHIEEAFCIQALNPPLNRRQEHLGTGFLP